MYLALNHQDHSWISNKTHSPIDEAIEAHDLIEDSFEDLPTFEELGDRIVSHISGIVAAYKTIQPARKLVEWQQENGL